MTIQRFSPTSKVVPEPCPPTDERPYIKAWNTPPEGVYHAVCLHSRVLGFLTHHVNGATRPCLKSDALCPGCRAFMGTRWEGYIGICLWPSRSIWIAKITASAYTFSDTIKTYDGNLYARRISFQRLMNKKNGPLKVMIGDSIPPEKMPRSFDLVGALSRRWSMDLTHLRDALKDDSELLGPPGPDNGQEAG